jgi:DNA repair photolyase
MDLFPLPAITPPPERGHLLHPTPLGDARHVLGMNLTRGCVHRCAFCCVRGSEHAATDDGLLIEDAANRLDAELRALTVKPRAVFVGPGTDPFPPRNDVQHEAVRVVEVLARHGVQAWLMTRGFIRPPALDVLARHRKQVRVTVAFTTLDRSLQSLLEPGTAPPRLRLRQLRILRERDIPVQVSVDPLLPGITDTRENLVPLLAGLASVGIQQITAGYAFLRGGIGAALRRAFAGTAHAELLAEAYKGGPLLTAPGLAPARFLPQARRQRGYATLMALASEHGISVQISRISNPDFTPARPAPEPRPRLLQLFLQAGRSAASAGS